MRGRDEEMWTRSVPLAVPEDPEHGNCYQIPHNVHYEKEGWRDLIAAYVEAVLKAF